MRQMLIFNYAHKTHFLQKSIALFQNWTFINVHFLFSLLDFWKKYAFLNNKCPKQLKETYFSF